MHMVWYQRPCKTIGLCFRNQFCEAIEKILPIIIGSKYFPAFDPSDNHMVQCTGRIYSRFPWHDERISHIIFPEKHKIIDVPD